MSNNENWWYIRRTSNHPQFLLYIMVWNVEKDGKLPSLDATPMPSMVSGKTAPAGSGSWLQRWSFRFASFMSEETSNKMGPGWTEGWIYFVTTNAILVWKSGRSRMKPASGEVMIRYDTYKLLVCKSCSFHKPRNTISFCRPRWIHLRTAK